MLYLGIGGDHFSMESAKYITGDLIVYLSDRSYFTNIGNNSQPTQFILLDHYFVDEQTTVIIYKDNNNTIYIGKCVSLNYINMALEVINSAIDIPKKEFEVNFTDIKSRYTDYKFTMMYDSNGKEIESSVNMVISTGSSNTIIEQDVLDSLDFRDLLKPIQKYSTYTKSGISSMSAILQDTELGNKLSEKNVELPVKMFPKKVELSDDKRNVKITLSDDSVITVPKSQNKSFNLLGSTVNGKSIESFEIDSSPVSDVDMVLNEKNMRIKGIVDIPETILKLGTTSFDVLEMVTYELIEFPSNDKLKNALSLLEKEEETFIINFNLKKHKGIHFTDIRDYIFEWLKRGYDNYKIPSNIIFKQEKTTEYILNPSSKAEIIITGFNVLDFTSFDFDVLDNKDLVKITDVYMNDLSNHSSENLLETLTSNLPSEKIESYTIFLKSYKHKLEELRKEVEKTNSVLGLMELQMESATGFYKTSIKNKGLKIAQDNLNNAKQITTLIEIIRIIETNLKNVNIAKQDVDGFKKDMATPLISEAYLKLQCFNETVR
jgi:hypothetical protein